MEQLCLSELIRNEHYRALHKSPMHARIMDVLTEYGPQTFKEIGHKLGKEVNSITGRMMELRDKGLVEFAGRKPCAITKKTVSAWKLVAGKVDESTLRRKP